MKTTIITLALAMTTFLMNAQQSSEEENTTTISVSVPVQSSEGSVIVGLYEESNFMRNPTIGLESAIENGTANVTFEDVAPGTYAVILFHDKNGNKQMDFEVTGMPKESYGVSNNVMSMGPPQWSDAKFEVSNEPISLEIRM